jgi:flagellar basal body rod protein FlgG
MVEAAGQLGSSIDALMKEYHTVAHNIANVNTTGYKRQVNKFARELMNQASGGAEESVSAAEIKAEGAIDFSTGSIVGTGRPLDVAILGKGFFVVETPEGPLYTRNGVFQINTQGQLVDLSNRIVAGAGGPIVVPPTVSELEINIAGDGNIRSKEAVLGKLRIVDFGDNESELEPAGKSCFRVRQEVIPSDAASPVLKQGYRENSNVKLVEELVDLIGVSRLYEINMSILRKNRENSLAMIGVANS